MSIKNIYQKKNKNISKENLIKYSSYLDSTFKNNKEK